MLEAIINKFLVLFLFMSVLSVIRHGYFFIQAFLTSTEEQPVKYKLSSTSLFYLCLSLAYILSVICTGIKL